MFDEWEREFGRGERHVEQLAARRADQRLRSKLHMIAELAVGHPAAHRVFRHAGMDSLGTGVETTSISSSGSRAFFL